MNPKIKKSIKRSGWPVTDHDYCMAHMRASKAEKKKFGAKSYNSLNKIIEEKIPQNELAASHTKKGTILISAKIPKKFRKQLAYHENVEHKIMVNH